MVEESEAEEAHGLRGGELAPRSSQTPSPEVFLSLSPDSQDTSLPTETRRMCRVPESRTGGQRRTAIPRVHPGADVQVSRPGTVDTSEWSVAGGASCQGMPATRRTDEGATPEHQRGQAEPRSNAPARGTTRRQDLPCDNPRADGDERSAAAAGATAARVTAGGASAAYRSAASNRSEGRSRQ